MVSSFQISCVSAGVYDPFSASVLQKLLAGTRDLWRCWRKPLTNTGSLEGGWLHGDALEERKDEADERLIRRVFGAGGEPHRQTRRPWHSFAERIAVRTFHRRPGTQALPGDPR